MRGRIGLDIDSTLLDTMVEYVKVFNEKYGTNHYKNEIKSFNFHEDWGISKRELYEVFDEIDFNKVNLCDSSIRYVTKALKLMDYEIDLITASTQESLDVKLKRLTDLGVSFDNAIATGIDGKKGKYARQYTYIVDDSVEQLTDIFMKGGNPLCYAQPWNEEWYGNKIYNMSGLLRYII